MDGQVKYSSLSQPPSIHASPINYNRACNTTYNSPIGTSPYHQSTSPYNNSRARQVGNYQNYSQQQLDSLNYQQQQQYNLPANYLNQQTAVLGQQHLAANYPVNNYSLNDSPLQVAGTESYHYGGQHQLPHSLHSVSQAQTHGFPFYDDPGSPIMDPLMTRPATAAGLMHANPTSREMRRRGLRSSYSLDRGDPLMGTNAPGMDPYMTRDWSLERLDSMMNRQQAAQQAHLMGHHSRARDRSLERGMYLRGDDPYLQQQHAAAAAQLNPMDADYLRDPLLRGTGQMATHQIDRGAYSRDTFIAELQARLNELQTQYGHVKRELDATTQKLGSSMHSIKTFWSPELKKERAQRKEEAAKYALLNDQLKILRAENQVGVHRDLLTC